MKTKTFKVLIFLFCMVSPIGALGEKNEGACKFKTITFSPHLKHFSKNNSGDWTYDYSNSKKISKAIDVCHKRPIWKELKDQSYVSECFFRNKVDPYYSGMGLHTKDKNVFRIRLHFREGSTHSDIEKDLKNQFGKPNRMGNYYEEKFHHNLVEWETPNCRIIYDFGGVKKAVPTYLIFESLPVFEGGFNPPHVNLKFLKKK